MRAKGLVVVAIPLAALVTATSLLYLVQQNRDREQDAIRQVLRVREQIQNVLTLLLNAETGVRGYGVSEDPSFLRPYRAAFDELPAALTSLEQLTGDDPAQAASARNVRFLAGRKLEVLDRLASPRFARRDYGPEEPLIQEDNDLMTQLRDALAVMRKREEKELRAEVASARDTRARVPLLFGTALGAGLVLGVLAMLLFTTGVAHRVTRLEESARRLAKGEPLLDRPPGDDEVGRLAQALQDSSELLASRENELRQAKETAERASHAKSEFLSRTSHELRNPLTSMLGLAHVLSGVDLEPKAKEAVGHMINAGEHLGRLLNDFLDITRIEAGALAMTIERVPLRDQAVHAGELLRPLASERSITIEVDGPETYVLADEQRLQQILLNLISNAVKYNRENGNVRITWAPRDQMVRITVADDGPGIAPEKLDRLFTPYERLGAETTGVRGVGLGLPISLSLAELMGGRLDVRSIPDKGCELLLDLPGAP